MRLINADKLVMHLADYALSMSGKPEYSTILQCIKAVEEQPTIDPVKRGRWIQIDGVAKPVNWLGCYKCSVCGNYGQGIQYFQYCPSCGAKNVRGGRP